MQDYRLLNNDGTYAAVNSDKKCDTCLYYGHERSPCIFGIIEQDIANCQYVSAKSNPTLSEYPFNIINDVIQELEKPIGLPHLTERLKEKYNLLCKDNNIGRKYDEGKLRWDLLPLAPIEDTIRVLMFGAKKYGAWSWVHIKDFRNRYYSALMRHITAWYLGEELDKESGLPHLSHALCNLIFLDCIEAHKDNELPTA